MKLSIISVFFLGLWYVTSGCNAHDKFEYELLVEQAEDYLVESNFKKALKIYDHINSNSSLFIKEKVNAFNCCIILNRFADGYNWAKILIQSGVPIEYFDEMCFKAFRDSKYFKSLKKDYNSFYLEYQDNVDTPLVNKLRDLVNDDQRIYCEIPTKKVSQNQANLQTFQIDSILIDLVKKHGFFSELNTGININNGREINIFPFYFVLYRHSYQSNSEFYNDYVVPAYKNGIISKVVYENIHENDQFKIVAVKDKIYVHKDFISDKVVKRVISKMEFLDKNELPFLLHTPYSILDSSFLPEELLFKQFIVTDLKIDNNEK